MATLFLPLARPISTPAGKALALVTGIALLTLSAKIQVPFWPVPMTLQTLVVLMIGALYGAHLGAVTVLSYAALGAIGVPVFASGAGLAYLLGPTGGFVAGFVVAAFVVGLMAEKGMGRGVVSAFALMLMGDVVIFSMGVAWLSTLIGFSKAIAAGVMPFLLGEALKITLATALYRLLRR